MLRVPPIWIACPTSSAERLASPSVASEMAAWSLSRLQLLSARWRFCRSSARTVAGPPATDRSEGCDGIGGRKAPPEPAVTGSALGRIGS
eukprot:scaffold212097_cov30-Tisochrysis_lutea.AAC.3